MTTEHSEASDTPSHCAGSEGDANSHRDAEERHVPAPGLGTIPLARLPREEAVTLIAEAVKAGFRHIDTARVYGEAESFVGEALSRLPSELRALCVLSSKSMARDAEGMRRDIETSLETMGVERIDYYLLHQIDTPSVLEQVLAAGGAYEALVSAREAGVIGGIGISGHFHTTLKLALESAHFDMLLGRFNMLASKDDLELAALASAKGMLVASMKVFEGGFVTRHCDLALRYAALLPHMDVIFIGMDAVKQLEHNLELLLSPPPLEDEERKLVETLRERLQHDSFCSYCGYCTAVCPQEIPVSHIFNMDTKLESIGDALGFKGSPGSRMYIREFVEAIRQCTRCGICEAHCPNALPIRDMLEEKLELFLRYAPDEDDGEG